MQTIKSDFKDLQSIVKTQDSLFEHVYSEKTIEGYLVPVDL